MGQPAVFTVFTKAKKTLNESHNERKTATIVKFKGVLAKILNYYNMD